VKIVAVADTLRISDGSERRSVRRPRDPTVPPSPVLQSNQSPDLATLQQLVAPQFVEKRSPGEAADRSAFGFNWVLGDEEQLPHDLLSIGRSMGVFERPGTLSHSGSTPLIAFPRRAGAHRGGFCCGFWVLMGLPRDTRGSLLHPAVVDAPSVQPVSALTARCRGRRSCGIEFGW
jgi:hypothetical protein